MKQPERQPVPVKNETGAEFMADAVHERLREAILGAEFRPNHRLVEEEIATWLQVSRTPVREALLRLKFEGLVIQRKGWIVKDHSPDEILELIEARACLEAEAAYLAAGRHEAETLERLTDLASQMESPELARSKNNELNNQFHELIMEASGNAYIARFARRTRISYWNFNRPVVFTPSDDEVVNTQHRQLIEAIGSGDGDLAAKVAREHVGHTASIIAAALEVERH